MCNECNQQICDSRCPYNTIVDDVREYCICCSRQFEKGESVYFTYDEELFCIDCISKMTTEEIINNFLEEEII